VGRAHCPEKQIGQAPDVRGDAQTGIALRPTIRSGGMQQARASGNPDSVFFRHRGDYTRWRPFLQHRNLAGAQLSDDMQTAETRRTQRNWSGNARWNRWLCS